MSQPLNSLPASIEPAETVAMPPKIILITGNMAAGKSTVAQALAQRLAHSVHLRGDLFRRMIVNGRAEMGAQLSAAASQQLELRYELSALVALRYLDAGFTVVYQDIHIGVGLPQAIERFYDLGIDPDRLAVVVLCPPPDVVMDRDTARHKTAYVDWEMVEAFDRILRTETPRLGYWLDNSNQTVDETVAAILAYLDSGESAEREQEAHA